MFSQTSTFYIPDTVTEMEEEAFRLSWSEEIFVPASVRKIGQNALPADLQTIYYEGDEAQWKSVKIDNKTDQLKNVAIMFNCQRR